MLQNKIYRNFIIEILKIFFVILLALSTIALTVRAVNFLDLIVENGYPIKIYFQYSFLNLIGIAPKFIPFSFLLALTIFIIKHLQNSEFLILWTSGVKKIQMVNLFFFTSIIILFLYLIFSTFLTPYLLNKSRFLLNQDEYNLILPTLRAQQFNDSFKGLVLFVEKKSGKEISNVFLQDKGNNFKNLSSNLKKNSSTNIMAQKGIVENKKLILLNGMIVSSKDNNSENEIIKFQQLDVDLSNINTTTIKNPKLQETSTLVLIKCFLKTKLSNPNCTADKEIISALSRRIILPLYIPVIALVCSLLIINNKQKYLNKNLIFFYSFLLLVTIELTVRYTGINSLLRYFFIAAPMSLMIFIYSIIIYSFSKETN